MPARSHALVLPSITVPFIIGDSESTGAPHNGANVIALNQQTGSLLWITQVDPHPAICGQSVSSACPASS